MNAANLYRSLEHAFQGQLHPSKRQDGMAFFWEHERTNPSTRLVRISENAMGGVREIKLAQSSLGGKDVFMTLPVTNEEVADAVRSEIQKLLVREPAPARS